MTQPEPTGVDPGRARVWVESWERQQELYAVAREERFDVVVDLVEATSSTSGAAPVVVDLGCGPGSLAVRVARRIPGAQVVGIDADPLLMALGRAASPEVTFLDGVVGAEGWTRLLPGTLDAAVSSTALHYLSPDALERVYADLARVIRPGGVLVNADHLGADDPVVEDMSRALARRWRPRTAPEHDWTAWWDAVGQDPALGDLVRRRQERALSGGDHALSASHHLRLLRRSGFAHCGVVWRRGPSAVVVAVR